MTANEKKYELLKSRIQTDFNVDNENLNDLFDYIKGLLKKGNKESLRSELQEIVEDSSGVEKFVEWVWDLFSREDSRKIIREKPQDQKLSTQTTGSYSTRRENNNSETTGSGKLLSKAFNDVKQRDKEPSSNHQETKAPRFKPAKIIQTNASRERGILGTSEEKLRSLGGDHKPVLKLKKDREEANAPTEQKKTGSILDRVVKVGDKRPNPSLKEEEKVENKYEKIEKKVKTETPNTETKRPVSRTIKTAAQVREEERLRAQAQEAQERKDEPLEEEDLDEEESFPQHPLGDLKSEAPMKLKTRCRNWPFCKNEQCLYHHPTENCKAFPSCSYGDKCLYIHPAIPCKFGEFCQRANCAYVHPRVSNSMNYFGMGAKGQAAGKYGAYQQPMGMKGNPFLGYHPKTFPKSTAGLQGQSANINKGGE